MKIPRSGRHFGLAAMAGLLVTVAVASARADEFVAFDATEDVVYGHKDGSALTLDVVQPRDNAKNIGVILVSSGSWRSRKSNVVDDEQRRRQREHWIQGLLGNGYTVFVVRHGSGPRYFVPEMVDDVRRSVRFVRMHADKYGIDAARLGITSGSSGGHLSLMAGLTGDDGDPEARDPVERHSSRVQSIVAWFPPTDLVNWGTPGGYKVIDERRPGFLASLFEDPSDIEARLRSISPIEYVTKDDPPVLLIHGDADATVPLQQSEVLKAKFEEVGLPMQLVVQPGGGHTFWPGIQEQYPTIAAWFDRYLRKP